jgi:hypothetical protein
MQAAGRGLSVTEHVDHLVRADQAEGEELDYWEEKHRRLEERLQTT